jgi:uncharacterized membrane protein
MFISFDQIVYIVIIVLSLSGFSLAYYIHHKKNKQAPLVCPLNGSCDDVIHSNYSHFFGIPLERIGIGYYAVTALVYLGLLLSIIPYTPFISFCVTIISLGALLFSMYLIGVQAFVLRKWCTWCIFSAIFSTLIAVGTAYVSHQVFIPFLIDYKSIIVIIHAISAGLGVGAATIADIMFFKALKDYRISSDEAETFRTLSQVLWCALGILILTGSMLYLGNSLALGESSKFLVKVVIVGVVTLNGVLLNLIVAPKLTSISFGSAHEHHPRELIRLRRFAFAFGAISIISWYVVFILGSIKSIPISFGNGIGIYGIVIVGAIIGSQIFERYIAWRRKQMLDIGV